MFANLLFDIHHLMMTDDTVSHQVQCRDISVCFELSIFLFKFMKHLVVAPGLDKRLCSFGVICSSFSSTN